MTRAKLLGKLNELILARNKKTGIKQVTLGLLCDIEEVTQAISLEAHSDKLTNLVAKWEQEAKRGDSI